MKYCQQCFKHAASNRCYFIWKQTPNGPDAGHTRFHSRAHAYCVCHLCSQYISSCHGALKIAIAEPSTFPDARTQRIQDQRSSHLSKENPRAAPNFPQSMSMNQVLCQAARVCSIAVCPARVCGHALEFSAAPLTCLYFTTNALG
jgi:hypothetical protein